MFDQSMVNQVNIEVVLPPKVSTPDTRIQDFVIMNPPKYHVSKVDEDLVEFLDKAYCIMIVMGVPPNKKVELVAYGLKGITKVWYDQRVDKRGKKEGRIAWKELKGSFLHLFFPLFTNLRQDTMNVREYFLKFIKLSSMPHS